MQHVCNQVFATKLLLLHMQCMHAANACVLCLRSETQLGWSKFMRACVEVGVGAGEPTRPLTGLRIMYAFVG